MRISRRLAIAAFAVLAFFSANSPHRGAGGRRTDVPGVEDEPQSKFDDAFVYDVVTRFNESLLGNIDAIDAAVTAVLAGDVAVGVFAIDKIRELHHAEEIWAVGMLSSSLVACVLAYVIGFPIGPRRRDGVNLRPFVADVIMRDNAAISNAVETVMRAGELNLTVRLWKRTLVVAAMLLLLVAGIVIALARLGGNVVQ